MSLPGTATPLTLEDVDMLTAVESWQNNLADTASLSGATSNMTTADAAVAELERACNAYTDLSDASSDESASDLPEILRRSVVSSFLPVGWRVVIFLCKKYLEKFAYLYSLR